MKVLLVDDQAILMDGIANLLSKSAYEVVEKANSIDDALRYFNETEFDILLDEAGVDRSLPALVRQGGGEGVEQLDVLEVGAGSNQYRVSP